MTDLLYVLSIPKGKRGTLCNFSEFSEFSMLSPVLSILHLNIVKRTPGPAGVFIWIFHRAPYVPYKRGGYSVRPAYTVNTMHTVGM